MAQPCLRRFPQYSRNNVLVLLSVATLLTGLVNIVAWICVLVLDLKLAGSADPAVFCILVANVVPAVTFSLVAYYMSSKSLGYLVAVGALTSTYAFLMGILCWYLGGPEGQPNHANMRGLVASVPKASAFVHALIISFLREKLDDDPIDDEAVRGNGPLISSFSGRVRYNIDFNLIRNDSCALGHIPPDVDLGHRPFLFLRGPPTNVLEVSWNLDLR